MTENQTWVKFIRNWTLVLLFFISIILLIQYNYNIFGFEEPEEKTITYVNEVTKEVPVRTNPDVQAIDSNGTKVTLTWNGTAYEVKK